MIPKGLQNVGEMFLETFWKFTQEIIEDKEESKMAFPLVFTFFIFISTSNLMGLLPGFGTIGHPPILRSVNSDLNSTLAWAVISILGTQMIGILACGFFRYSKRFFNFKGPIQFFMGILELSEEDKLIVKRARRIQKFLSPPFHVAEVFSGIKGVYVEREETVRSFKEILEGKHDEKPESAFYMKGSIEEVK